MPSPAAPPRASLRRRGVRDVALVALIGLVWTIPCAALALAADAPGVKGVPDEAVRSYAREQLLVEARRALGGGDGVAVTQLDAQLDQLSDDREALEARARAGAPAPGTDPAAEATAWAKLSELVDRRAALLSGPAPTARAEGSAPAAGGALADALWLLRWLRGQETCSIVVRTRGAGGEAVVRTYPQELPRPADTPVTDPPPDVAPPPSGLAVVEELIAKEGSLLSKSFEASPCRPFLALVPVAASEAAAGRQAIKTLISPDAWTWNEPLLRLRQARGKERVDAWGKEAPGSALVDEATVREKARRVTQRKEEVDADEARRKEILRDLDGLVQVVSGLRGNSAELAAQIEEARAALPPAPETPTAGEVTPPLPVGLRVLEAQEALGSLQMRLFYLAALWLEERLRLVDEGLKLARRELAAAEAAHRRFADEMQRVRSERLVDRLTYQRLRLEQELEHGTATLAPAARDAFLTAHEALLRANAAVLEFVRLRRPDRPSASTPPVATPAPAPPTAPPATPVPAPAPGPPRDVDELAPYRTPTVDGLDRAYVRGASEHLDAFDAALVAAHHDAAVRRVEQVRRQRERLAGAEAFERRGALAIAEAGEATDAFARTPRSGWRARALRVDLEALRDDLRDAAAQVAIERERVESELVALTSYRSLLLDQGRRSFSIRENPQVNRDVLERGGREALSWLEGAARWLAFRGDEHLGTLLSRRPWRVAALVVLAVLAAVFIRRARRALDRRLAAWSGLRTTPGGAGVAIEDRIAKARRELATVVVTRAEGAIVDAASSAPAAAPAVPPPPALSAASASPSGGTPAATPGPAASAPPGGQGSS